MHFSSSPDADYVVSVYQSKTLVEEVHFAQTSQSEHLTKECSQEGGIPDFSDSSCVLREKMYARIK
jgi:hypothetical protein